MAGGGEGTRGSRWLEQEAERQPQTGSTEETVDRMSLWTS